MRQISRRDVIVSSTAAAAAFGVPGSVRLFAPDSAKAEEVAERGFHRFNVGDVEVTTIFDGIWEKPHDPAFIRNASVEDAKSALRAAGLDDSKITIPFTVTVAKLGEKTIMFDAGTGGQLSPLAGRLGPNMKAAGIDPTSISAIFVTHFHPDHIFGLMEKDTNAQIYPNAEIVVPASEIRYWTAAAPDTKPPEAFQSLVARVQVTLAKWGNVRPISSSREEQVFPGVVAVPAAGHTPGHTTYVLGSGKDQMMVLADLTNIPALFARHPNWHAVFDADPGQAEQTRRRLFDRAIAENAIITGYHYGMPGAGRMQRDGDGYAFVPLV